jgi:hypothetical protein
VKANDEKAGSAPADRFNRACKILFEQSGPWC